MADDTSTLTTFYASWQAYQEHIKAAIAPLTAEQLALRAAPHLRSIGEITAHIIGCRAGWFTLVLGEAGASDVQVYANWDWPDAPARTGDELAQGLDHTWQLVSSCLSRWTPDEMRQMYTDRDENGKPVELSLAWIVYHVMEHDLHHGGELALTLGMHGLRSDFPG